MIAIVDYRAGNLTSVRLAFEALGVPAEVTSDADVIRRADRVVFPGVGAAGASMQSLREMGLVEPLRDAVDSGRPFLGICMGMQVLLEHSEENGGTDLMGVLPGRVTRFQPLDPLCKIPQMGWNAVKARVAHPVFDGIEDESEFYFVHSYYCAPADPAHVLGETDYAGVAFCSAALRGNLVATQFHPERSGRIGLKLLKNFIGWNPT